MRNSCCFFPRLMFFPLAVFCPRRSAAPRWQSDDRHGAWPVSCGMHFASKPAARRSRLNGRPVPSKSTSFLSKVPRPERPARRALAPTESVAVCETRAERARPMAATTQRHEEVCARRENAARASGVIELAAALLRGLLWIDRAQRQSYGP